VLFKEKKKVIAGVPTSGEKSFVIFWEKRGGGPRKGGAGGYGDDGRGGVVIR